MNPYLVDEAVLAARVEDDVAAWVELDVCHRYVSGAKGLDGRNHKGRDLVRVRVGLGSGLGQGWGWGCDRPILTTYYLLLTTYYLPRC